MEKAKKYTESLKELNNIFYLILERYKTEYPLKEAYPTEENNKLYADSKAQLENTYKDLFILENNIDADTSQISSKMQNDDNNIQNLEKRYSKDSDKLAKLNDGNLASYPLQRQFAKTRFYNYFDLTYFALGSLILVYLLWISIVAARIPVATPVATPLANVNFLPTAIATFSITPTVAKIATAGAALLVGFLAYYHS